MSPTSLSSQNQRTHLPVANDNGRFGQVCQGPRSHEVVVVFLGQLWPLLINACCRSYTSPHIAPVHGPGPESTGTLSSHCLGFHMEISLSYSMSVDDMQHLISPRIEVVASLPKLEPSKKGANHQIGISSAVHGHSVPRASPGNHVWNGVECIITYLVACTGTSLYIRDDLDPQTFMKPCHHVPVHHGCRGRTGRRHVEAPRREEESVRDPSPEDAVQSSH